VITSQYKLKIHFSQWRASHCRSLQTSLCT